MNIVIESLSARPVLTLGLSAFLPGIVLYYFLMKRSRRDRIEQARKHRI